MRCIDLIRHAESEWVQLADASPVPLFGGRMNEVGLSSNGDQQATNLGIFAREHNITPVAFFSSPAVRALRTHELSARAMGRSDEATIDVRLQELDWGSWTGQPRSIRNSPRFKEARRLRGFDFAPPGGESINGLRSRALTALHAIIAASPPGLIWIHTHRNLIKSLVYPYFGWSAEETAEATLDVVSLTRFTVQNGELKLLFFNQTTV